MRDERAARPVVEDEVDRRPVLGAAVEVEARGQRQGRHEAGERVGGPVREEHEAAAPVEEERRGRAVGVREEPPAARERRVVEVAEPVAGPHLVAAQDPLEESAVPGLDQRLSCRSTMKFRSSFWSAKPSPPLSRWFLKCDETCRTCPPLRRFLSPPPEACRPLPGG